jgi:hypothetical protein
VLAIFIVIAGVLSIVSTPKDIFPSINIPVISVIFPFPGMTPRDLEEHLTTVYERILTTTVDNIEHIESESLFGISVIKIYLQPNASVPTLFRSSRSRMAPPFIFEMWRTFSTGAFRKRTLFASMAGEQRCLTFKRPVAPQPWTLCRALKIKYRT